MINQDKILSQYTDYMSSIEKKFPISEELLKSEHKKIKSKLFSKRNSSTIPSNLEKKIETEFIKYSNQNNNIYTSKLNVYLLDRYKQIKENIQKNKYKNIQSYIDDIKKLENDILSGGTAPEGPYKILHILEFFLEQILEDCEIIINNFSIEYDSKFDENKKEADEILNEINKINNSCQQTMVKIKEKENLIKQIEMDKKVEIKQAASNSDKITNLLKIKSDKINKLNEDIEKIENKHDILIQELKNKIKNAENIKSEKEKISSDERTKFESQKVELSAKIDFLEKQIKNLNEARVRSIKSLTVDLLNSGQNTEMKKIEDQITNLNKKIQKLISKNNELSKELAEKEKAYENEKNKSKYLIEEYEKKLKSVNEDHEYIENKSNEIQNEENENLENLKTNYEKQISELKSNFSKDELIVKSNIEKYTNLIQKCKEEFSQLKKEYNESSNKLNSIKEKNDKEKNDQANYIKILEENNKRIMSQYDSCVKENNNLKAFQRSEILRINSETEKKIVSISKDNETILNDIKRKKIENNDIIQKLQEKLSNLESQIPLLQKEQGNLEQIINDIYSKSEDVKKKSEEEISDIKNKQEKELEDLKKQCLEDLEQNKKDLKDNLEFATKECEQQKEELLQKIEENREFNKQHQQELIDMYSEKIKILEQVKDEKIDDLTNEITEIEKEHYDYVKDAEEEMKETEKDIDKLNGELIDVNKALSIIQIEHEKIMKNNKEKFKNEREELEKVLYDLLQRYNKISVNISLSQKINDDLNIKLNKINEKIDLIKNKLEQTKSDKEKVINELTTEIKNLNLKLLNSENEFNEKMALKNQEIEYYNNQINSNQKELDEFKGTFNDKISQFKEILISDFVKQINSILSEKKELENIYNKKQSEYQSLEQTYNNQILLLTREKDVLTEKLKNVNVQIEEVESNLKFDKNNNYIEIESIKQENTDKINQLMKENEALRVKLSQVREDYNEINEVYETDKALWKNKYAHLLEDKDAIQSELFTYKNKYNINIDDLSQKLQNDRITLQKIYNEAIEKRDEKFNNQISNANKYFAHKFEYVNNLNQELTLKNNELINTLNEYESQANTREKETKLEVTLHSIQRYKKEIVELYNNKDKDIEELQNRIIMEKKNYSNKILELQKKLRDYEIKRSVFSANKLKQNVNSEKDSDEQEVYISRLKAQIAALEKTNFMLKIDKRDVDKDNDKILRTRKKPISNNLVFIPNKSRLSTYIKENQENNLRKSNASTRPLVVEKKNLFNSGFNRKSAKNLNGKRIDKNIEVNESNSDIIINNDI